MQGSNNFYPSSNSSYNPIPKYQPRSNGFQSSSQFYSLTPNASSRPEHSFDFDFRERNRNKPMFQSTIDFNSNPGTASSLNSFARGVNQTPLNEESNRFNQHSYNKNNNHYQQQSQGRMKDIRMASSAIFPMNNQGQDEFNRFPSFNLQSNFPINLERKGNEQSMNAFSQNNYGNESAKEKRERHIAQIKKQVDSLNKKMLNKPLPNISTAVQQMKSPKHGGVSQSVFLDQSLANTEKSSKQQKYGVTETRLGQNYKNWDQQNFNQNNKYEGYSSAPKVQLPIMPQNESMNSMKPYSKQPIQISAYGKNYEYKEKGSLKNNQFENNYKNNISGLNHVKSSQSIPTTFYSRPTVIDPEASKDVKMNNVPKYSVGNNLNNISQQNNQVNKDQKISFLSKINEVPSDQTGFKKKKFYQIQTQVPAKAQNIMKGQEKDLKVTALPDTSTSTNNSYDRSFKLRKIDSINYIDESIPLPEVRNFKLSDFWIGKKMGKGQFGEVLLVRHKLTGWLCGLKVMNKKDIKDQQYVDQIARELSIQFYLQHRNIAQLYGYFEEGAKFYLLIEFCAGGQLLQKIRSQKRMNQNDVSRIIRQVCQGVDFMHKEQIIHRDLKPQNILFNFDTVKISDFGWAVYRGFGMRKTASGSPLYYPPEIVKGQSYDDKIDVWTIGMMAYECLEGKIPFKIYSQMDLERIVSDEISFPSYVDISEQAKDFILKTMKKKGQDRIQIRQMLRHPLLAKSNQVEISQQILNEFHKVLNG